MKKQLKITLMIGSITLLSACGGGGGGGDSDSSTPTPPAPVVNAVSEGVWEGSASTNYAMQVLVLENGDFYSMFGKLVNGFFGVVGFDQGTSSVTGSTMTAPFKEYMYTGATSSGTLAATVVNNVSLNGTATYSTGNQTIFTTAPTASTSYNYGKAANISDISGSWSGSMLNGSAAAITVSSTGTISGTNAGCSFTGTVAPRSSGKNVFNVSVKFGPTPCALPGQTATGIALDYLAPNSKTQLLVVAQDSTKAYGTMFFAQR